MISALKRAVPGITVYVYDNNSSDDTSRVAAEGGGNCSLRAAQG